MPNPNDSLRNIANRLVGTDFRLADSRNNPVGLPISDAYNNVLNTLKPKNTITRTNVPELNQFSKVDESGEDGMSILVSIVSPDGTANSKGFTPQSSYYLYGASLINPRTGFAKEMGHILSVATLNNNTALDKISRTNLVINEKSNDPKSQVLLYFSKQSVKGRQNIWGNQNISTQDTYNGWVNPLHYITKPDDLNPRTGLPRELGDFPYNYNNNFGANFFRGDRPGVGVNNLILSTPKNKVDGPANDGIQSTKEVFDVFRQAKDVNIRMGGFEMYDFVHLLDRLQAVSDPGNIPKDIYLASFVEIKDQEDPVWFGYDIFIDYESSPLFNGAVYDFIREKGNISEVKSRADVYQNFVNQFRRFFKLQTTNDGSDPLGTQSQNSFIVPVANPVQNGRNVYKTFYLKKIVGLDLLVESQVTNSSESVKSMVNYGTDIIKLTLYEDVTVNTGYLAMLYKTLSWSRLNGKQIIPENLLRFDIKIVINEVRNYNKIMKRGNAIEIFADDMNKYIYKLYDCQFMFDKLSHGDDINMWEKNNLEQDFDIAFNFKYSNLTFEKNLSNRPNSIKRWRFDNGKVIPISNEDVTNATNLKYYDRFEPNTEKTSDVNNASTRESNRLALQDAGFDIIIPPPIPVDPIFDPNVEPGTDPIPSDNRLDDIALIDSYTQRKNPWDLFNESDETTFEALSKITSNTQLRNSLENKARRENIGSYNRKIDLISRTASNLVEFNESQIIGVASNLTQTNNITTAQNTNTVDVLRLSTRDTRKITRFLQKNNFDSFSGNTGLNPGNYLFVSTKSSDLATAQEKAIELALGRPSNEINNLISGQSQVYFKRMSEGNYLYNFFSPIT
jgi:hypothetical protein